MLTSTEDEGRSGGMRLGRAYRLHDGNLGLLQVGQCIVLHRILGGPGQAAGGGHNDGSSTLAKLQLNPSRSRDS